MQNADFPVNEELSKLCSTSNHTYRHLVKTLLSWSQSGNIIGGNGNQQLRVRCEKNRIPDFVNIGYDVSKPINDIEDSADTLAL